MHLTASQRHILHAMAGGWTLKAHRYLDGRKEFRLHPLRGEPETVPASAVQGLVDAGLLDSNKKFPAATFWLTERGRAMATAAGAAG